MEGINDKIKTNIFFRSLFICARLNPRNMQGLGLAASIEPYLNALYTEQAERREALYRHLAQFNSHPYFSTIIAAAICDYERRLKAGELTRERMTSRKNGMASSFAAVGDLFFWGNLKPLAAIVSCLFLFTPLPLLAPLVFILLYNIPHLLVRIVGFRRAFENGDDFIQTLENWNLAGMCVKAGKAYFIALGLFTVISLAPLLSIEKPPTCAAALSGILIFFAVSLLKGRNWHLVVSFLAICLILGFICQSV